MQKATKYAAGANGGAWTVIRCTMVSSRLLLQEDSTTDAGLQGYTYELATMDGQGNATYGPAINVPPQLDPTLIAGYPGDHPPNTVPIGNGGSSPYPCAPGGKVTHGTIICRVTSATATPTVVDAIENS